MTWSDELRATAAEAAGDVGLLVALVALRRVENGGPGREFGVLSVPAPTYADQLHVAAISLQHRERQFGVDGPTRTLDGFYDPQFLYFFSSKWAPVGAGNDPNGSNQWHSKNLVTLAGDYAGILRSAISRLG